MKDQHNAGNGGALVLFLISLTAMASISMGTYLPSLDQIAREFGASASDTQSTLGAFLLGYAVGNLFLGTASDHFGRKRTMIAGLSAYILITLSCMLVSDIFSLTALRAGQGIAASAGPVLARAILRDRFEGRTLGRAFAILSVALGAAPALGPLVGGVLQVWWGWRSTFAFMAAYGVLLLVVGGLWFAETRPNRGAVAVKGAGLLSSARMLVTDRGFTGFALSFSLLTSVWFAYMGVSPFIFVGEFGLSPATFGLLSAVPVAGFVTGALVSQVLAERLSMLAQVWLPFTLMQGACLAMLIFSAIPAPASVLAPMYVFMVGQGIVMSIYVPAAMQAFPAMAGTASSLLGFLQLSIGFVANLVASRVYTEGIASPSLVMSAFVACAGLVLVQARPWNCVGNIQPAVPDQTDL